MAHTYDTKAEKNGATNPLTLSYTCGSGATLLVLCIVVSGGTLRTGGKPTYDGVEMTTVYEGVKYSSSPEANVSMYYLIKPPTGSAKTISVPNTTATPRTMWLSASSYKAQSGYTSAYDVGQTKTGLAANPSDSITTTVDGDVCVQVLGDGLASVPTGRTHTALNDHDFGSRVGANQYALQATAGSITMGFTVSSDDYQMITASWKEIASFSYSASGGVSVAGIADVAYTKDFVYSISGGLTVGGSTVCEYGISSYEYVSSGGVAVNGSALTDYTFNYITASAGGIYTGGTAVCDYTSDYSIVASGGLVTNGTAVTDYTFDYSMIASGGLATGGTAPCDFTCDYSAMASGGLITDGTAVYDFTRDYQFLTSGGLITGGEATYLYNPIYLSSASGGLTTGGTAVYDYTRDYQFLTNGGLVIGGEAVCSYEVGGTEFQYVASGGLLLDGSALYDFTRDYAFVGSGGLVSDGEAVYLYNPIYLFLAQGGLVIGGIAEYSYETAFGYIGSGLIRISGEAVCIIPAWLKFNLESARVKLNATT